MGRDEQKEEREVLESIFPDEITDISETEYRLPITLELPESLGASDDDDYKPTLHLRVSLPEAYPDTAPDLDLSLPPNAPRIPHLDLGTDKPTLLSSLAETIDENLGMAMLFTLVTTLKDSVETLVTERVQAGEMAQEAEQRRAEEEENRKFEGERVTRDRFLEWRERFRREMREAEERRREEERAEAVKKMGAKAVRDEEKKLTGKELWLRGIAKGDDEEVEGMVEGMESANVAG